MILKKPKFNWVQELKSTSESTYYKMTSGRWPRIMTKIHTINKFFCYALLLDI